MTAATTPTSAAAAPATGLSAEQRMIVKQGEKLRRYEAGDEIGEGEGVKAGVTYKLSDGRLIYVPEAAGR